VASIFTELYPRVMVSSLGAANDLTAQNTASASYALTVMTVVLAVLLPVVLVYQGWTYHVFRGRLRGPQVGGEEPGPVVPVPRRERPSAGSTVGSEPAPTGRPAPSVAAGTVDGGRQRGRTDGAAPMGRLATGGIVSLVVWLLMRQLLVSRARPPALSGAGRSRGRP
jgi:Cytochrome bd terminal oxidase subunit II